MWSAPTISPIKTAAFSSGVWTGNVTITSAVVTHNYWYGISITTKGTVTLSSIESVANGLTMEMDGINLLTHGKNALVQNSVISGNGRNGIYANLGGAGFTLTVKKTYYMGNNRDDPYTVDPNIHMASGTLVIIP